MSRFRTSGRSIFDLIVSEHKFTLSTYANIQQLVTGGQRESPQVIQLCFMLIRDLCVHSHKEEVAVYPLLQKINLPNASEKQPNHACHEHVQVERQLAQIENELERSVKLGQPIADSTLQMMEAMMGELQHHIEDEEQNLLPALQQSMTEEDAIRLGREWEGLNGRVATRPHPDAPTLGALAASANAAQAPLDALLDEARFKHVIPTAPGSITADALTPFEQGQLGMTQPTPGPHVSTQMFHPDALGLSDLRSGQMPEGPALAVPLPNKLDANETTRMGEREKQMEMEM